MTNTTTRANRFMNRTALLAGCIVLAASSCKQAKDKEMTTEAEAVKDNAVSVVSNGMDFQLQDTIKSGWQTFRYTNKSNDPHFMLLEKYPEGKTIEDGKKEVVPVFQKGMDLINEGDMDAAMKAFGELPEWFGSIVMLGGTGLVSPGETAVTTLHMEPGYYGIECYVKMPGGVFHSAMGMLEDLVVTADSVAYTPPVANAIPVYISSTEGIVVNDSIGPGLQVFEVNFVDQKLHEHFIGHDVNLVRLDGMGSLEQLEPWMNWSDPKGLITPAPAGVTFLGGVNEMPAGNVGYFSADLAPGEYALISEVPSPAEKKMVYRFSIGDGQPAP
jgi:hypothetical protein